jgi:hypothetical protein
MNAATNQPSILTLRLGQSDQAGQGQGPRIRAKHQWFERTLR